MSLPRKFLSRRDKNNGGNGGGGGSHRRGKSAENSPKNRPLSADTLFSIFKPDAGKSAAKGETEQEKESVKIDDISRQLQDRELPKLDDELIRYALNSKYAAGNVEKAVEILILQQKAFDGTIVPYDPDVQMAGAENRGSVTCYLDALLFAMFAKLEAFECMLRNDLPSEPQRKLAALLRLWVNMLRTGKLIHTDMTEHIQDALAACGWPDAKLLEQQDTSEAFAFMTDTLQLPLLTLQADLFHQGKNDDADHKVIYERLLNLAVPSDTEGKGVRLEDCLEEYFNSQVDVQRDSTGEEKKIGFRAETPLTPATPATPRTPKATIRIVHEDDDAEDSSEKPSTSHEEVTSLERRWTEITPSSPDSATTFTSSNSFASGSQPPVRPHRARTASIIQRVVLDDEGKPTDSDAANLFQRVQRKVSVVKAVTIPAWQFFRLIPWHSTGTKEPQNDLEVAQHFRQRPVVGICLKRYMVDEQGVPKRQNTFIDIPDSLRLPHFIVDERGVQETGLNTDYKLVLQSVVCHRGDSVQSGHYVSFCRVAPKLMTDNRRHDNDPPPDYEEAQWVKFDDLATEGRVTFVDDIKQSLKDEMPYLLFYQIVPIVDVTAGSTGSAEAEPPAYADSGLHVTLSEPSARSSAQMSERPNISRQTSDYFDGVSIGNSTGPSVRFSAELERPPRKSDEACPNTSRRGSTAWPESAVTTPGIGPDIASSAVTPAEETTAQRLSRAAQRFKRGSNSRPTSQAGEGRISLTMSRLGGLMRASKDPLREVEATESESETKEQLIEDVGKELDNEQTKDSDAAEHHQHHHKKSRSKSKSRGLKSKSKSTDGGTGKGGEEDRECAVM